VFAAEDEAGLVEDSRSEGVHRTPWLWTVEKRSRMSAGRGRNLGRDSPHWHATTIWVDITSRSGVILRVWGVDA
jgi:hypothetical protein